MVGLTYTPPLLPSLAAQVPTAGFTQIVAEILGAHAPGVVEDSLTGTLLAAAGSGNVITGTVTATAADGSVTLLTASGVQISLHHPPELPLNLGSTVTLRVVTGGTTPQAIILQVDGRPVAIRSPLTGTPTPTGGTVVSQSPPSSVPAPLSGGALPGADAASAYAATLAAVIDLEEQASGIVTPTQNALSQSQASTALPTPLADQPIVAILVRPAPAKPGQAPLPTGTRYLLVPLDGSGVEDGESWPTSTGVITNRPAAPPVTSSLVTPDPATVPSLRPAVPAIPTDFSALASSGLLPPATDPATASAAEPPDSAIPNTPVPAQNAAASAALPADPSAPSQPVAETVGPESPLPVDALAGLPAAPLAAETLPSVLAGTPTLAWPGAVAASSTEPEAQDLDAFVPQNGLLAGRVVPSSKPDVTLVETAVGTLALTGIEPLPSGTALRLRILGVALPDADASDSAGKTPARGLIEHIIELLAGDATDDATPLMGSLTLPTTSPLLLASFWTFFANTGRAERAKETLALVRQALSDADRDDLGARLSDVASDIGEQHPSEAGDGWLVTILPFLGFTGEQPMRLYIKADHGRDGSKEQKKQRGERFVLEVVFARLGPMQFDGLVRDRRFDLALRTGSELDPNLRRGIETVFADALGVCGWSGEIVFGRTARFPLMQRAAPARHGVAMNV